MWVPIQSELFGHRAFDDYTRSKLVCLRPPQDVGATGEEGETSVQLRLHEDWQQQQQQRHHRCKARRGGGACCRSYRSGCVSPVCTWESSFGSGGEQVPTHFTANTSRHQRAPVQLINPTGTQGLLSKNEKDKQTKHSNIKQPVLS